MAGPTALSDGTPKELASFDTAHSLYSRSQLSLESGYGAHPAIQEEDTALTGIVSRRVLLSPMGSIIAIPNSSTAKAHSFLQWGIWAIRGRERPYCRPAGRRAGKDSPGLVPGVLICRARAGRARRRLRRCRRRGSMGRGCRLCRAATIGRGAGTAAFSVRRSAAWASPAARSPAASECACPL